jgi:biopolymer transport protein ExbB
MRGPLAFLAQDDPAGGSMSLLEYVKAGGSLGYLLIALSVVVVALIARNMLALRRGVLSPPGFAKELSEQLRKGAVAAAAKSCAEEASRSYVARTMAAAIRRCAASPMGALEARASIEDAAQVETMRLHRLNNGLGVLAAVGPMLGLLGTVIGMIGAFNAIGSLQGAARSTELARFMSLALVNTAQGLVVAVPATVAFALFRQRIDRLVTDVAVSDLEPLADDLAAGIGAAQRAAGAARRA